MPYPFIRYGGNYVPRQPYDIQEVICYGFAADGDQRAMQALCDKTLNFPHADPAYKVISPTVLFSFMKLNALRSADPEDSSKGSYTETEFSVAMLLAKGRHEAGIFIPEGIVWYFPYLWLDSGTAMISGREIYGYPKQFGKIEMPLGEGDPATFAVSAEAITSFAPNACASLHPIVGAYRTDGPDLYHARGFEALEDAAMGFLGAAVHLNLADFLIGTAFEVLTAQHLLSLVFLRQFPDIADGRLTCYQSIAETSFEITRFGSAGFLDGQYAIDITGQDSAPIAAELGFPPVEGSRNTRIAPHLGFFLDFDFRLNAGREVWVGR